MMSLFNLILSLVLVFMMGVYNGVFLRWHENPSQKNGIMFHSYGFLVRIALLLLLAPGFGIWDVMQWALYLSVWAWVAWIGYDALINLWRNVPGNILQKIFYSGSKESGTTSIIDKYLGKYLPIIKMIYTGLEIVFIVLYITN